MNKYSEVTSSFLENENPMSYELAMAIIQQFGGESEFIDAHVAICENESITGWSKQSSVDVFFDDNKAHIVEFVSLLADNMDFDSMFEQIQHFMKINDKQDFDVDQILNAINDPTDKNHMLVITSTCDLVVKSLSCAYMAMTCESVITPDSDNLYLLKQV